VGLWGEVDREVGQSPVRKRDSLRRQYAKCFFVSEVQGEGNCGRVIDRGKEACEMCREVDKSHESAQSKAHEPFVVHHISRHSCEATNRNVIEAQRDPEVSCPWTAKPFPTDSGVDGELVQ